MAGEEWVDTLNALNDLSPYRRIYLDERDDTIFCLVSKEDYQWAIQWRWTWSWDKRKKKRYAKRMTDLPKVDGQRAQVAIFLHKEILSRMGAVPATLFHDTGDHLNGDSLDNTRDNLCWATVSQNNANRKFVRSVGGRFA